MGIQSHTDDTMSRTSLFILLILGACGSQAKFVHHNETNHEFELDLEEMGTRLTQKIRFDADGLRITEVPPHNGRVAARYVFDDSMGLQMNVIESKRTCSLYVPIFNLPNEVEKAFLEENSHQEDEEAEFLKVEPGNTMTLELIMVEGPELDRADVPSKMAKYCPEGFQFFAVKQIPASSYNVHKNGENEVLIEDPRLQKDMNYGDQVDFSDLFQILPMTNRRSSRVKRECRWANDTVALNVADCHWVDEISCEEGCPANEIFYRCVRSVPTSGGSCEYLLLCKNVVPGIKCIMHLTAGGQKCRPCCRARDCGGDMQMCPNNHREAGYSQTSS